jgi:CRISPR/Cas system-associated exonuclease Cas4 (RecB family)
LIKELGSNDLPRLKRPVPEDGAVTPESEERVDRILQRVRSRPRPLASELVLPVTHLQDYFRCPRRYLYAHRVGLSEFPLGLELDADSEPGTEDGCGLSSKREQGTIAHRLLERLDLSLLDRGGGALQAQLKELLWIQGIDPTTADARQILSWLEAFSRTSFARRLSKAGPARVHRELPFIVRLDGQGARPQLYLKGQIDLLFEDEEGRAVVIDYKTSSRPSAGLGAYEFQLDCYGLATRQFVKEGVPVMVGIVFLQTGCPEPEIRRSAGHIEESGFEERLRAAAAEMLAASADAQWPGRDQPECATLRCGYQYRCHPEAAGI